MFCFIFFSKTQLAMELPAKKKKTRVATQVECGISQWLTKTLFQNGFHFNILLFAFKLALLASFKVKHSFEF